MRPESVPCGASDYGKDRHEAAKAFVSGRAATAVRVVVAPLPTRPMVTLPPTRARQIQRARDLAASVPK